ncbi:MAG: phosphodiesterase [Burkholderiales bacterium]|jgi:putative phosphoesterase|nr:MAG: phosphodiesterase [Burkholderiales bacterium]
MKICIVSDSHDRSEPLAAAVSAAKKEGAAAVIHCGDVIGPHTLRALLPIGLPVHVIHGNNLGDPLAMMRLAATSGGLLHYHGTDARLDLAGRRVFVVHYPDYGLAMATTGEWDLVCCGHSHQAEIRRVRNVKGGHTLLVNPGTVAGIGAPATYAFGDLNRLEFAIRPLPRG